MSGRKTINPFRIVYAYQIIQGLDRFMMYDIRCKIYDFSPAQTSTSFFGNLTCHHYNYITDSYFKTVTLWLLFFPQNAFKRTLVDTAIGAEYKVEFSLGSLPSIVYRIATPG